jgi:hypothetical protein
MLIKILAVLLIFTGVSFSQSRYFDGVDDIMYVGTTTATQFDFDFDWNTTDFTIMFWLKNWTHERAVMGKVHNTPMRGWWIDFWFKKLCFELMTDRGKDGGSLFIWTQAEVMEYQNRWTHYAFTYEGKSELAGRVEAARIYINGKSVPIDKYAFPYNQVKSGSMITPVPLTIMRISELTLAFNTGSMDNLQIYNRVLSANEVMERAFKTSKGKEEGQILFLKMDETAGNVKDYSGRGNHVRQTIGTTADKEPAVVKR